MKNSSPFPQFPQIKLNIFEKVSVSSVLKDMIYVIIFIALAIMLLGIFNPNAWWIAIFFLVVLSGLLIFFCVCFYWLMKNRPDLLRSESYQLRKQQIEMMGNKEKEVPAQVIEGEQVIEKPKEKTRAKKIIASIKGGKR